jgi:hypothetical protein
MDLLTAKAQRLYKHPPPCPSTLAPHSDIMLQLDELSEVMKSFETCLIPPRMRETYFKPVIEVRTCACTFDVCMSLKHQVCMYLCRLF